VSGNSDANAFRINGTTVIDNSRNLTNIGTITASGGSSTTWNAAYAHEQKKGKIFYQKLEAGGWGESVVTGLNYVHCDVMARDGIHNHGLAGAMHAVRGTGLTMNPTSSSWYGVGVGFGASTGLIPAYPAITFAFPGWGDVAHAAMAKSASGNTLYVYGSGGVDRVDITCMAWV